MMHTPRGGVGIERVVRISVRHSVFSEVCTDAGAPPRVIACICDQGKSALAHLRTRLDEEARPPV